MRIPLAAALLALSAASAWADPRNPKPDWVDSQSMEYGREQYITGVGAGDDRATAEDRARAEISKVLSADVKVDTTLNESESTAGASKSFSQSIAQTVKTVSEKVLEGVQLVEHWQDGATRVHYALAVLDRAKTKAQIVDKLKDLDKQALGLKSAMESSKDKLDRAQAAMKLLTVLRGRQGLNAELRVVDAASKGLEAPFDETAAKAAAARAVASLEVAVGITGENAKDIETGLLRGLTGLGLQARVGSKSGSADVVVEGSASTERMKGDGSKWQWARTTASVTLKDGRTGKIFSSFQEFNREASADFSEAGRRSRAELAKKLAGRINQSLTAYFENH